MRVTFLAEQLLQPIPGGIGAYVRALMRHLPAQGVEVEPVVAKHRETELYEAGLPHARRLRAGRRLAYKRWETGHGPRLGGKGDIVHAPSLAIPRRDRRPLVVTVHDVLFRDFPETFPPRGLAFHEAMLKRLHEADSVIVPSRATAVSLAGMDDPHPDVHVVPMGTEYAPPSSDEVERVLESLDVRRPYVLWCGTVEPRKNPEGVVRGFVHALGDGIPQRDELSLYLVGPPGWWSGDVGELLSGRELTDRVRRLGEQPAHVRAAMYAGAEAFLFPSLAEGFGLPVVEAMACGCPVVTSNRSSLPEIVGSAALLCDPDDPASIGGALATLLRDPELAADLRRLGARRASGYTWERTARMTAAVYKQVLGSR